MAVEPPVLFTYTHGMTHKEAESFYHRGLAIGLSGKPQPKHYPPLVSSRVTGGLVRDQPHLAPAKTIRVTVPDAIPYPLTAAYAKLGAGLLRLHFPQVDALPSRAEAGASYRAWRYVDRGETSTFVLAGDQLYLEKSSGCGGDRQWRVFHLGTAPADLIQAAPAGDWQHPRSFEAACSAEYLSSHSTPVRVQLGL
jgi:hypothetical protein